MKVFPDLLQFQNFGQRKAHEEISELSMQARKPAKYASTLAGQANDLASLL